MIRWLAVASFIPPALALAWAAMIGREDVAVAGTLLLVGNGVLWWRLRR